MPIEVDYRFPPGTDVERHAKMIAVGQTAGTWGAMYEDQRERFEAHLGEVLRARRLETGEGLATVRFPDANVEGDIGTLLTMIFGKYSMAGPAKISKVRLPEGYGLRPKVGMSGLRKRLGVDGRPLIMAIFKPALGLSAEGHAAILRQVAEAGIDIIKDDEILGDLSCAPVMERLEACREVLDDVEAKTNKRPLYAVNVTGPADVLIDRAVALVAAGANALLLNVLSHGFSVLEALTRDERLDVPIFAHPALAGALCAAPNHGFRYSVVLGTLMAHAGADAVLYPAHYGSMPFDPREEAKIRDALRERDVAPVPSAGIHPGIVGRAIADYGNEVVLNAGTGIMDHPGGPGDGTRAFFEAIEHHASGRGWDAESIPAGPLRVAIEKWGSA